MCFPFPSIATKVKKAVAHTLRSPDKRSSVTALINTSMDVSCVHVTKASTQMEFPDMTGCKKSTESVDAVTTDFRACLTAAMAATSSTCAISRPPNKVPKAFVSGRSEERRVGKECRYRWAAETCTRDM